MVGKLLEPKGLCQIAFVVNDIEAAISTYCNAFGFARPPVIDTPGYAKSKTTVDGQPSEATAKLAFFQTGQLVIELIEPDQTPSVWRDHLNAHGEGVHHIAFGVADTQATQAALAGAGISTLQQGLYADGSGMYTYVDTAPALGVMIELLESFPKPQGS